MTSISGEMLSREHRDHLERGSGISSAVIAARQYETFYQPRGLPPIFRKQTLPMPGMLIPVWNTQGEIGTHLWRPDYSEPGEPKYQNPAGGNVCLDVPAACWPYLLDIQADLWITEGSKKVDSAVSHGLPCIIGLLGVAMWQRDGIALPDWKDVALKGRRVIIAFDSDVLVNPKVRTQLDGLAAYLAYRGARVNYCILRGWNGAVYP